MEEGNSMTDDRRWVRTIRLRPPSIGDNTADADRLVAGLRRSLGGGAVRIDFPLLPDLPSRIRRWDYSARCLFFDDGAGVELFGVYPPDAASADGPLGLAVDLGTSRVVLRLIDLETGEAGDETAFDNPQIEVGQDILTRIHHAESAADGRETLRRQIVDGINDHIGELTPDPTAVGLLAVAGNTAMGHLLLGLDPRFLIREPYIPAVNAPGSVMAADLGLRVAPRARVFIFPNVGSYFGGDLIAGIMAAGLHRSEETAILVDVGTNAEVVVGNRDWLIACAGAAGPALEGGVTRMGMMAGPGVVDRVAIDPDSGRFDLHTIEDAVPRGICGSGLIDLAAELFRTGRIDLRGKLVSDRCGDRFREIDDLGHLIVVPADQSATGEALTISQADLDSLIRSKAAMYTILETVTQTVGVPLTDLAAFNVAGTFGSFIRPESAITLGMIPDLPRNRFRSLGNSSLAGAGLLLADGRGRIDEIRRIRDRITYLELNVNQDFMNRFSAAKFIPHTDPERFPSVASGR